MHKHLKPLVLLYLALFSGLSFAGESKGLSQQQLAEFARKADFRFGVLSNFSEEESRLRAHIVLHNGSSVTLSEGEANWRIYFHSVRRISFWEETGVLLTHINGDLYELAPAKTFKGLAVGATMELKYGSGEWAVSYSDFMPRAFIVQPGLMPEVFINTDTEQLSTFIEPFTTPQQQLRFGGKGKKDLYPIASAESRYQDNLAVNRVELSDAEVAHHIIPSPKSLQQRKGSIRLDGSWQIRYAGRLTQEASYLAQQLKSVGLVVDAQSDNVPASGKVIRLIATANRGAESYEMSLDNDQIELNGSDNAGVFYAVQSLLSLIPASVDAYVELPILRVFDSPRYTWRGMHYDMARNFHGKAVTLRLIEQMARYKLNKLHLHLSDDEGWRIAIPGLPELTDIGGRRCFDLTETQCLLTQLGTGPNVLSGSGNGYYTTSDFVEILRFAATRHVEIIPEIDMPGHARAAIKSMQARYRKFLADGKKVAAEQYLLSDIADQSQYISVQNYTDNSINVCLSSTYIFAEKVIYELQQMYRAAGLKLTTFHMGGDEVGKGSWEQSPACKSLLNKGEKGLAGVADLKPYFVRKISEITYERGLNLAGWEDGLMYDPVNAFNRKQFSNEKVYAHAWDNIWEWGVADRAYRLANAGYQVILSPGTHLYFDHPFEANAKERGYYWAARYTDTAKVFGFMPDNYYANADKTRDGAGILNLEAFVGRELPKLNKPENMVGIQGQVWSETIRTPEQLEQMIYPRLIALAERAWYKADWESDVPALQERNLSLAMFTNALAKKELPKLAATGSAFYLPPPGGIIQRGKLLANTAYPGLEIEYSLDEGGSWQIFSGPVAVTAKSVQLHSRLKAEKSRITVVTQ